MTGAPVVYLAFANDNDRYLAMLQREAKGIANALAGHTDNQADRPMSLYAPVSGLYLKDGKDDSLDRFKLVGATRPVDGFVLQLDRLPNLGQVVSAMRDIDIDDEPQVKPIQDDWFVKDLKVRLARRAVQAA